MNTVPAPLPFVAHADEASPSFAGVLLSQGRMAAHTVCLLCMTVALICAAQAGVQLCHGMHALCFHALQPQSFWLQTTCPSGKLQSKSVLSWSLLAPSGSRYCTYAHAHAPPLTSHYALPLGVNCTAYQERAQR